MLNVQMMRCIAWLLKMDVGGGGGGEGEGKRRHCNKSSANEVSPCAVGLSHGSCSGSCKNLVISRFMSQMLVICEYSLGLQRRKAGRNGTLCRWRWTGGGGEGG